MKKNNVITFRVCEKTQKMMDEELDWCKREKTPPYAKFQAKDGDTVITLYESGKVVFQGSDADLASDFWITTERINSGKVDIKNSASNKSDKLDESIKVDTKIYNSSSIGSDEVGTGDYFGPIVVTSSYVSKDNIKYLEELGVKDSKKLTDDKILEIVPLIIKKIPYKSVILSNKESLFNYKYEYTYEVMIPYEVLGLTEKPKKLNVAFAVKNGTLTVHDHIGGDINGDNTVNMKDLVLLQQYINSWDVDVDERFADVNGDNAVNMKDLVLLQQYINGWEVELH